MTRMRMVIGLPLWIFFLMCPWSVALSLGRFTGTARGSQSALLATSREDTVTHRRCVIVGGGPVSLAAALTLSNPAHSFDVTVLEKTTDEELVSLYDPGKAYLYNVNPRGLQWVTQFPNVLSKVLDRGYSPLQSSFGRILQVPADPEVPIPPMNNVAIAGTTIGNATFDSQARSVWIPRHLMVELMMESCQEQEKERTDDAVGSISIVLGHEFADLSSPAEDGSLVVTCRNGATYPADLVVGADGINSAVREHLKNSAAWRAKALQSFRVRQFVSPATGLRLKSLQLPGDMAIPNTTASDLVEAEPTALVVMRSVKTGTRRVSLGMLPVKDKQFVRPANVIARPDHEVWSATTGDAVKAWMQEAFPRLPFDKWVNATEWERFAQAKGLQYPKPQYSPGSAVAVTDTKGVVLVGDACHAFPPDIGQGINAGLQDVQALDRALKGQNIRTGQALPDKQAPTLGAALLRYQANRGPEHRALIRLSRFGAPYQYNQSWLRDRIGKKLWFANFLVRTILNKLTLGLVPPHAMVLLSNAKAYSYRQVMRRCDSFNLFVRALGLLWLARWAVLRW